MGDNADALAARTLHDITLPGSHDSASFFLDGKVMPGSLPWPLNDIVQMATDAGTLAASYIIRWSQSQTLDIAEQLEAGIRYFDLRAGVRSRLDVMLWVRPYGRFPVSATNAAQPSASG